MPASQSVSRQWGREFGRWLGSNDRRVPCIQNGGEEDGEGEEGKVCCKARIERSICNVKGADVDGEAPLTIVPMKLALVVSRGHRL